jgi:2-polyprenyl-6-methoxyphenol hydroxylase-like FAD-dependent oxidoreductase
MNKNTVLITGAGPTGLVLALWLTKIVIPVRLIDQSEKPGTTSRALVLHARNLEFYRQLGIDQVAIERSIPFKVANLWLHGKKIGTASFGDLGVNISPYPYALIFPQDLHEQMLVEQLELLGIRVERNTTLLSFRSTENKVVAQIKKKNGEEETYEAAYLAGCDGAHSIARKELGIEFAGGTYQDIFYVADLQAEGAAADGQMHGALDDADFLAIFPMKGKGRIRLVGSVRRDLQQKEHLAWDDVSQHIIQVMKIDVKEVKWFSTYHVHHRVASHFQQGNVFLLGDAAHIHSPVGGQGMNTGIGDAVNLAWKLGAVLQGTSPASLLPTYETERIAFARQLVDTTDRAFVFVTARGRLATWVRLHLVPLLIPFLFRFAFVRRKMYKILSQTSIRYPKSPISAGNAGRIKGGDRLPWVNFPDGTNNYESLRSMDWQLHCYGEASASLQQTAKEKHIALHIFPWNKTAQTAGLKQEAFYLIRPDGHVALAGHHNTDELCVYLKKWVRNSRK